MRRPCQIRAWLVKVRSSGGSSFSRSRSTFTGSVWRVSPRRRERRPTWVSTVMAGRHPAVVIFQEGAGGALDGAGLVAEEAGGVDLLLDLLLLCCSERLDGTKAAEEPGGDLVDPLVGALGGENRGHQKLPHVLVGQGAVGFGVAPVQAGDDLPGALAASGQRLAGSAPCGGGNGSHQASGPVTMQRAGKVLESA